MKNNNVTAEPKQEFAVFHLPTKAYSVIDSINRYAAGQGSVEYAQKCADSNYNGHYLTVCWNDYRGYYIAEYYWGQRVVIARGNAEEVLRAAIHEFQNHQGRGASFSVRVKLGDAAVCEKLGLVAGKAPEASQCDWYTPLHAKVGEAGGWERQRMGVPAFAFLANSKTVEEYESKLAAHLDARRKAMAV